MSDIFISYKREDRERARAIAEMFASYGFDVWWDVNLLPGQDYAEAINSVINKARAVIVLWTRESVQADWVRAEALLAFERGILIPTWLEKTEVPVPFNALHTHDLTDWHGGPHDEKLQALLAAALNITGQKAERIERTQEEINEVLDKPIHEAEYWATVSNGKPQSIAEYEAYLEKYGRDGTFAELARLRIDELEVFLATEETRKAVAKISIWGIELAIDRIVGIALILIVVVVWWNWAEVCKRVALCGDNDIEVLRAELHSQGPSRARLKNIISLFEFNERLDTSLEEAKLLMGFLHPHHVSHRGRGATSGTFGPTSDRPRSEVTIWTNSYDNSRVYGVRFGLTDGHYYGCNDSYFEIEKLVGGEIGFNDPSNFALCPPHSSDGVTYTLTIKSNVENFYVDVNGKGYGYGDTPVGVELEPGTNYRVRVTKDGYEPFERDVSLTADDTVTAILTKIPISPPSKCFGLSAVRILWNQVLQQRGLAGTLMEELESIGCNAFLKQGPSSNNGRIQYYSDLDNSKVRNLKGFLEEKGHMFRFEDKPDKPGGPRDRAGTVTIVL